MSPDIAIALAVLTPLVVALGVGVLGRWPNSRDSFTIIGTLITGYFVAQLVPVVMDGGRPELMVLDVLPIAPLAFKIEPLGMLFAMVASGLWVPTSIYAMGYMRGHREVNQTRFFVCFALAIFAALGIAFSANLLTLFLFYEVLTFSTYPLVTHHGTEGAKKAGRIYLGILVFTSVAFLLLGVIWTGHIAGTLDFQPGGILEGKIGGWEATLLLALFAYGTGKAALFPFHRWLPNAMVAPTPVSALLHAVAVVKAGVFTVLKVVIYIFGLDLLSDGGHADWLKWVATFTIVFASVVALTLDNLKARLAYSTISQLAYIVLGGALATSAGVLGGGMHIAMHAVGKITLFFCAGAIYVAAHKTLVSELNGLGRKMPITMGAFFLGSLSIIGLPPMGGAWSKWYLALGAAEGQDYIFVGVFMLSSLLSIGYLMPVVGRAFFLAPDDDGHEAHGDDGHGDDGHGDAGDGDEGAHAPHEEVPIRDPFDQHAQLLVAGNVREAPLMMVVPLALTAVGCIILFFFAQDLLALLEPIVSAGG